MGERDKWKRNGAGMKAGKTNKTMQQGRKRKKKIEVTATWEGDGKIGVKKTILNLKMTNRTQFL